MQQEIVFSTLERKIGDRIPLVTKDGKSVFGVVVYDYAEDPRFHNLPVHDVREPGLHRLVNNGRNYYRVEVE